MRDWPLLAWGFAMLMTFHLFVGWTQQDELKRAQLLVEAGNKLMRQADFLEIHSETMDRNYTLFLHNSLDRIELMETMLKLMMTQEQLVLLNQEIRIQRLEGRP